MSAPITDADRAAAHEALIEKPIMCDDLRPGISHDWICEDVAQAIADARATERRIVAAYLVDRADQYVTESGSWVGLVDAAQDLMDGEFEAAVAHGELEDADLLKRVDGLARRSR